MIMPTHPAPNVSQKLNGFLIFLVRRQKNQVRIALVAQIVLVVQVVPVQVVAVVNSTIVSISR